MKVLILTGACGVGKSSTAKEWAKRANGAIIECDYFTEWIYKKDFPHWTVEEEYFTAKLTAVSTLEYLKNGMSVAIDNVWSPVGIQILVDLLKKEKIVRSIKVVWLYCDISENHKRDEQRILSHQMKERVGIVNNELKSYEWQDIEQVVDFIEEKDSIL